MSQIVNTLSQVQVKEASSSLLTSEILTSYHKEALQYRDAYLSLIEELNKRDSLIDQDPKIVLPDLSSFQILSPTENLNLPSLIDHLEKSSELTKKTDEEMVLLARETRDFFRSKFHNAVEKLQKQNIESPSGSPLPKKTEDKIATSPLQDLLKNFRNLQEVLEKANQNSSYIRISSEARPYVLINLMQFIGQNAQKAFELIQDSSKDVAHIEKLFSRLKKESIDGDQNKFKNFKRDRKIQVNTLQGLQQLTIQTQIDFARIFSKIQKLNGSSDFPFQHFFFLAGDLHALKLRLKEIVKYYRALKEGERPTIERRIQEIDQTLQSIVRIEESFYNLLKKCRVA